jgi:Flp pilus assembly protein TadD
MRPGMNIRKFATITVLVLSSFAATNVAPTKAELESMYDKAFREFNASNYPQALKELNAIDARQPDLAESQNLRGVILMRQAQYDEAEAALQKALATDPKFWNARFNLAEIPFLRKDWAEARKRFEGLLQGNAELQGEASQLIQYKVLLTYLLEGKENMVDSILAKFELSPDTPAVHYSNAAIAFQHKNEKEAKDLLAAAEKKFSPQLNKLFAESLYEVGWMQKPEGQTRVALEITTEADRQAKAKAMATEKFEEAEQAFQQRDLTAAKRLVDEADAADPNQPATINLRGEILLAQKDFDGAEAAFKQAVKIDPKFREAQYNLAQIPFKKKEYTKARERFEALFTATPAQGGDKNQAAQIIKFKIYLTLLLEGKESRAQKMMEQFQFTGDTPALYYAQAAWEFKHGNTAKAQDWIVSARKIYSPALNLVFADSFYDLGWIQQNVAAAPVAPSKDVAKIESTPSIEPSPIPASALAMNKSAKQSAEKAPPATTTETTAANAKNEKPPAPVTTNSPTVETPLVSNALPSESRAPLPPEPVSSPATGPATSTAMTKQSPATGPETSNALAQQSPANGPAKTDQSSDAGPATTTAKTDEKPATGPATSNAVVQQSPANSPANKVAPATTTTASSPATVLAPVTIQDPSATEGTGGFNTRIVLAWIAGALGGLILLWVGVAEFRRRMTVSVYRSPAPASGPNFDALEPETTAEKMAAPKRLAGGPPQISLHLKASEPSVRRAAVPFGKTSRPFGANGGAAPGIGAAIENLVPRAPVSEPALERVETPAVEPISEVLPAAEMASIAEIEHDSAPSALAEVPEFSSVGEPQVIESEVVEDHAESIASFAEIPAAPHEPALTEAPAWEAPMISETALAPVSLQDVTPISDSSAFVEEVAMPVETPTSFESPDEPMAEAPEFEEVATPVVEPSSSFESVGEPIFAAPTVEEVSMPVVESAASFESVGEPVFAAPAVEEVSMPVIEPAASFESVGEPIFAAPAVEEVSMPVIEPAASFESVGEPIFQAPEVSEPLPAIDENFSEPEIEPVAQGQPIPYQVPAFSTDSPMAEVTKPEPESLPAQLAPGAVPGTAMAGVGALRHSVESPSFAPQVISTEPLAQQPTTPATMPLPNQPTPAPAIRPAPMTGGAPQSQPASGMQTAVQLTFSFEIASLQLTPSFKMGALQLKPTSKIVTMRLAPSQQPQPAMNLQVTFEVSSVQAAGGGIGQIRLTPSQQQRPSVISTPAFNIAGLQLLSGSESGAVQLTPSQQGQASVHVTGRFQIATVEFSPSFEIASIVLNSTSKSVSVQLPGAGPSAVEGAPVFEIANVQLGANGEIGMMQLNAQGAGPKAA